MSAEFAPPSYPSLSTIALKLGNLMLQNSALIVDNEYIKSNFDGTPKNGISFEMYLQRIVDFTQMEISTLFYATKLLEKYCFKKSFILLHVNSFKLIFVCLIVSLKMNEDCIFRDKDMCKIGGISLKSFIYLETEFLEGLEYNLGNI